jgi:putative transposase
MERASSRDRLWASLSTIRLIVGFSYSATWRCVVLPARKALFSQYWTRNPTIKRIVDLYQGRYKCFPVETDDCFYRVVRSVKRNALRANLVTRAEFWPWSSFRRGEREDVAFPILSPWPLPRPADWLEIVNQPQTEPELEAARRCVNRGCPFGTQAWVAQTAKQLNLESTLRPRGRPRKDQ